MRDDAIAPTDGTSTGRYDSTIFSHKSKADSSAAARLPSPGEPPGDIVLDILARLGVGREAYERARRRSRRNGSDVGWELVCAGEVSEDALSAAMGKALGIAAGPISETDCVVGADGGRDRLGDPLDLAGLRTLRLCGRDLQGRLAIAPRLEDLGAMQALLAAHPDRRSRLRLVSRRALRQHQAEASQARRTEAARLSFGATRPDLSARTVWTGAQGFVAGMIAVCLLDVLVKGPDLLLQLLHLVTLPLFFFCALARLAAAGHLLRRERRGSVAPARPVASSLPHPLYSVLVPLRDEAGMVDGLVASLSALQWPASRLDVMLVCEEDDRRTIDAAAAAIGGRPNFTLVLVPPSLPRTKPKALNVALPLASGDYIVIYDAEDRPRPDQLEVAWQRFRSSDEGLACLQAPLVVRNGANSWLSGHFALEYAALFRGLLPWLSAARLPLPLGGTSNHFRRAALRAVGGWDSHNVTEDADLGMRLYRGGFRVETIDAPTFEDAPEQWSAWRNQRTRWMKGWMQTWLLHMRAPARLWRDLGARGFFGFQLLFFGMIASSVAHAFLLLFLMQTAMAVWLTGQPDMVSRGLLAVDAFNLVAGYAAFVILATRCLDADESRVLPRRLWTLALYWLLVSVACFRAIGQLIARPHVWEKTPHEPESPADVPPARPALAGAGGHRDARAGWLTASPANRGGASSCKIKP